MTVVPGGFGDDAGDQSDALDRYLDDPGAAARRSLEPSRADVVDALRSIGAAEWDRVAPIAAPRRPWRRDVVVAAAAVVVALGLLFGLTYGGGGPSNPGATGAGTAWHLSSLIGQANWRVATALPSESVTCPTPDRCYASDATSNTVEVSADGAQTFSSSTLPSSSTITTGLSCPDPLECWAGGMAPPTDVTDVPAISGTAIGGGNATTGGSGGSPPSGSGAGVQANPVDGTDTPILLGTVDGGGTWNALVMPSGVSQVADVDCTDPSTCVVAADLTGGGSAIVLTSDGGTTWTAGGTLPSDFQPAVHQGLSCDGNSCVLVGADMSATPPTPVSSSSMDGGATWSASSPLGSLAVVQAVTCPTDRRCLAIGQVAAGGGATASSGSSASTGSSSSTTGSSTIGSTGSSTTGSTVSTGASGSDGATTPYGPGAIVVSRDGGQTWRDAAGAGLPAATLFAVSCRNARQCTVGGALTAQPLVTGDGFIAATDDGGASFSVASLPAQDGDGHGLGYDAVLSLSCPRDTCVALAALAAGPGVTSGTQAVLATP